MTKQTTSLSLSKPEITDKIVDTITQLASNFDVIDSSLADRAKQSDLDITNANIASKADKTYADNIQTQVNSLVLGTGTASADDVQARSDRGGSAFPTLKAHLDNIESMLIDGQQQIIYSDWERGALNAGANNSSTYRIRTAGYHTLTVGSQITITPTAGYRVSLSFYDSNNIFVASEDKGWYTTQTVRTVNYPNCRVVVDTTGGTTVVPIANTGYYTMLAPIQGVIKSMQTDISGLKNNSIYVSRNGNIIFPDSNFDWTQNLSTYANKTFAILYDFTLTSKTVTLPSGCTLDFTYGGTFKDGTLVSPSNTPTGTNVVKLNIPEGKVWVIRGCTLTGYFKSVNKFYVSSLTGTGESDINFSYAGQLNNLLQNMVYSTIVFDILYRTVADSGNTLNFGEGLTLTSLGSGICELGNVNWNLTNNVTFKNLNLLSNSGSFFTVTGNNVKVEENTISRVGFTINPNVSNWKFEKNEVSITDEFKVGLTIYGQNGRSNYNNFTIPSALTQAKAITLSQGANFNEIKHNNISGGKTGIALAPFTTDVTAKGIIKNNIIEDNIITDVKEESISMDALLGSAQQSKDRFTIASFVSSNTVDVTLFSGLDITTAVNYISYVAFGLSDSNYGLYAEITNVIQSGSYIRITTDKNIFTSSMVGSKFGITFGFIGNIVKNNTVYNQYSKGAIDIHGCGFSNIIKDNKSYSDSYMAIYTLGGNTNYIYGNAYNIPMINNVISDNIVPYGGVLVATKVASDGSTAGTTDATITKYCCLYSKVRGNIVGLYTNMYGHFFSQYESEGNMVQNATTIGDSNHNNLYLFKFSSYKETTDKNTLIKNNGQRVMFLDSDGKLYLYNGDRDGSNNFIWKVFNSGVFS